MTRMIGDGISYSNAKTYNKKKIYQCTVCMTLFETYENAEGCHDTKPQLEE